MFAARQFHRAIYISLQYRRAWMDIEFIPTAQFRHFAEGRLQFISGAEQFKMLNGRLCFRSDRIAFKASMRINQDPLSRVQSRFMSTLEANAHVTFVNPKEIKIGPTGRPDVMGFIELSSTMQVKTDHI